MTKIISNPKILILSVGFATFFFGFGAGALLNMYLLSVNSLLVTNFRSTLTFKSAIWGDGVILPVINMLAVSFLIKHKSKINKNMLYSSLFLGGCVTAYFHITQAVRGLVNWAMPAPWQWNLLGLWHAIYMFAVASFLSLFFILSIYIFKKTGRVVMTPFTVLIGLIIFFVLLQLDYYSIYSFLAPLKNIFKI